MEKLNTEDFLKYKRNKNILFEGIQEAGPKKSRGLFASKKKQVPDDVRYVITPRIIEYPFVFQYLKPEARKVLDFGCVEDLLPLHLASMGYQVTGFDFRDYPFEHPNFSFIRADILQWDPLKDQFDAVVSVSTIEHVGLSAYGDPVNADGDKIAAEKLWQALRPGGDMIITVPAGKPCIQRGMRIYDESRIREVFPKVDILRFFHKPSRYQMWQEAPSEMISTLVYEDYNALAPAQGLAVIVGRKD